MPTANPHTVSHRLINMDSSQPTVNISKELHIRPTVILSGLRMFSTFLS
jgi:hypothetical protein